MRLYRIGVMYVIKLSYQNTSLILNGRLDLTEEKKVPFSLRKIITH